MSFEGWKEYSFSEFVEINPPIKLDYSKEYSFVEMKDLNENLKFAYPSQKRKLTGGARFKEYDTLFARITPCLENGKICQVKNLDDGLGFGSTEFLVFRGIKGISDTEFVFYLSRSEMVRNFAEQNLLGTSGRQRVNKEAFNNLILRLPPLETQRRIAEILSALDEKIELNRQTNATLEAMAQAIFDEWFVRFNFPGDDGERVESELGPIPRGWKIGPILELADLLSGGTPSTSNKEYWDGDIDWVSAKDVSNSKGSFIIRTERKISKKGIENSNTKILPTLTTIITARGTVGNYCILSKPMAMNQTNYGLKAKRNSEDYYIFYCLANLITQLQQASYGTIFDTITTNTFKASKLVIPPYKIIKRFNDLVEPIMMKTLDHLQQSITLAQIRDALLPKLMNGEIEV